VFEAALASPVLLVIAPLVAFFTGMEYWLEPKMRRSVALRSTFIVSVVLTLIEVVLLGILLYIAMTWDVD
jgi:hypothetical protein